MRPLPSAMACVRWLVWRIGLVEDVAPVQNNTEGKMAEDITVVQRCGICYSELGTFSAKKENLMLSVQDYLWCARCQATLPTVRDIAGREASIEREVGSYPRSLPSWEQLDDNKEGH